MNQSDNSTVCISVFKHLMEMFTAEVYIIKLVFPLPVYFLRHVHSVMYTLHHVHSVMYSRISNIAWDSQSVADSNFKRNFRFLERKVNNGSNESLTWIQVTVNTQLGTRKTGR